MENSVCIFLKSDQEIIIKDFLYITYPSDNYSKDIITVKTFENFYLHDRHLTFVGKNVIVSVDSKNIEFIKFSGSFSD